MKLSELREMALNKIQNSEKLLFLLLATKHSLFAIVVGILEIMSSHHHCGMYQIIALEPDVSPPALQPSVSYLT